MSSNRCDDCHPAGIDDANRQPRLETAAKGGGEPAPSTANLPDAAHLPGGRIRIGISSCLLGNPVRFDGGHKFDPWVVNVLGAYLNFVPVCPEVECGMGIPREALRLVGDPSAPRLVTVKHGEDWTDRMRAWAERRVAELEGEGLCGYIFKRASPSSGMERVKVYPEFDPATGKSGGVPVQKGVGMFARAFIERFPLLPVEEEGRLNDPDLRENFIERLFVMRRWRQLLDDGLDTGGLVAFHTRHKLLMLAHSPQHYRTMGKLVAQAATYPRDELREAYQRLLMEGLRLRATPAKHVNVLQHIMGYFRKQLTPDEKQEMLEQIDLYRRALVPLVVPVTLLNHYVRKYGEKYLAGQFYLNPHPVELKLRNHV